MTEIDRRLATLRRPRLLIRAARFGIDGYRREAHLPRLIAACRDLPADGPLPAAPMAELIAEETAQDTARRQGSASYSVAEHVCMLTALMAEMRLARVAPHVAA